MEVDNRLRSNLKHTSGAIGICNKAIDAFKEINRPVASTSLFATQTVNRIMEEQGNELVD